MLVCTGSCLFMIVSAYGFADIRAEPNVNLDPSRIAAQVVSGIGFLGAGSILLRGQVVRGLTTAASIWTVAAVGLAVGGGLYAAAGMSTIIIVAILAGVKPLEEAYRARNQSALLRIRVERGSLTPETLQARLRLRKGQVKRYLVEGSHADGTEDVTVSLSRVSAQDISAFVSRLQAIDGVEEAKVVKKTRERGGE